MLLVFTVLKYIGFGLAMWGFRQIFIAYRDDDADRKIRWMPCLVIGALVCWVLTILDVLGAL